jgi:hypothetical protein
MVSECGLGEQSWKTVLVLDEHGIHAGTSLQEATTMATTTW